MVADCQMARLRPARAMNACAPGCAMCMNTAISAMPVLRQAALGDLYIQVNVETPQNLSKRQRELLQEFESISSKENSPQSAGFFSRMKDFFDSLGDK